VQIFIDTTDGETEIMDELDVEISVLKALNGDKPDILTIGLVIHVSCELGNFDSVGPVNSCPSTSRHSCTG